MIQIFKRYGRQILDGLLWCVALGVLGMNISLLRENRTLQAAVSTAARPNIEVGKHLGRSVAAVTLDNLFHPIEFSAADSKRTLIITFSPLCPHCKANQQMWSIATKELRRRGGWRILWISRDPAAPTKDYCEDYDMPLAETFADPTYRTYLMLDLKEVPNTISVDQRGVVEQVWRGELQSDQWRQLFSYLELPPALMPRS